MKKAYKITWISLASVVGVVLITVLIACYLVFSPKRLTSLVNKHASKFITCEYKIGRVDLTLFKTFPDAGLQINDLVLINPTKGWTTDTLASIDECVVSLNIREMLFGNQIIINQCQLNGGFINAFFDTEGNNNFDIFPPSEPEEEVTDEESTSYSIDLQKLKLNNVNLQYTDLASNTVANVNGIGMNAKGSVKEGNIGGDLSLSVDKVMALVHNDTMVIRAAVGNIAVDGKVKLAGDNITANTILGIGAIGLAVDGANSIAASCNDLSVSYNGTVDSYSLIKGLAAFSVNNLTATLGDEKYLDNASLSFNTPLEFDAKAFNAKFDKSEFRFNDIVIGFNGDASMSDPDIVMNMDINTNAIDISDAILLIPESMRKELLSGINADGKAVLSAHVEGTYNDNSMPLVNAEVSLADGYVAMPSALPYPLTNVSTDVKANLNLNGKSDVSLKWMRARMNRTTVAASGNVADVLNKMRCDLNVKANVNFDDVKSFLPEELIAFGTLKADVNLKGTADQFTSLDLMHTRLNGTVDFNNLNVKYCDTISLNSSNMSVGFILPNPADNALKDGLAHVTLRGTDINAGIAGSNSMYASLNNFDIDAQVSNVLDSTVMMAAIANFGFSAMDFNRDDMVFHTDNAKGNAMMLPSDNPGNVSYAAVYSSDTLVFAMGDAINFVTDALALNIDADYDEKAEDVFLQWNPKLGINLKNAVLDMSELGEPLMIPSVAMAYDENGLNINNSRVMLGSSDFELNGTLTNIYNHFKENELLKGEFNFISNYTDVNQLMDLFSDMGADSTQMAAQNVNVDTTVTKEAEPFMVPFGVDIKLHTLIRSADAGEMQIHDVGGDLTVKDGILVLEEMGFTSDAAEMQLTAIYKSKRKNHLYVGFDFHLLDIDISEMIHLIPDLDTIVPMLKSFDGKAEFHFAAETNLKADYSPKYSTLKAACSIEGQDLVVLDGETFNKIKRKLFFSKKTENKIDSLDVQFTVFKNEIDVYPFAVSMDKYSAMLYGRHNLDMSFDYKISMLRPGILSRIGLEVKGPDFDHMKFKVRRSFHKNMFKPEKRDYKEEKIAEIKKIIANSLKENVKH